MEQRGLRWAASCTAWFALVAALAELTARALNARVLHGVVFYGPATVWMTPVADLVIFSLAALLFGLFALVVRPLRQPRFFLAWLAFLTASVVTLQVPRLHPWAAIVLALGLASIASRLIESHRSQAARVLRFTLPPLLLFFTVALVAEPGLELLRERRITRSLPAARDGAPNVLFLIFDTVRAASLGLYGGPPTTPVLDSLAREGVAFDRAIAPASYTLASHASFFTGRWPRDLGVSWTTPLDKHAPVIAEAFARAGYRTGGFAANRPYVTRAYGLARGFAHFSDYAPSVGEILRNTELGRAIGRLLTDDLLGRRSARDINASMLRWISSDTTRPYFAFANYFDAHMPYLPPPPCDTAFGWFRAGTPAAERARLRREAKFTAERIGDEAARHRRAAYEGAIKCLDAAVGSLLDTLRSRGLLRNTVVILSSDHGEEFGEHGIFDHGNSLYLPSLHVPLVMLYRDHLPAGRRVTRTVSLRDLPATILDVAGLPVSLPGRSMRSLWDGTRDSASADTALAEIPFAPRLPANYPVSAGDMRSIVTERWQLIRDGRGTEDLFDLARDAEGNAAATDSAVARVLRAMIPPGH